MLGSGALIFVTVGSLFPFDRLILAADAVAAAHPELEFFAQVGDSEVKPAHMRFAKLLDRGEFKALTSRARVLVAHAGMGSIITAMELGIPIIIVPRRFDQGEHNTDHQAATAHALGDRDGIIVCEDEAKLGDLIQAALATGSRDAVLAKAAPPAFTSRIAEWINTPRR
jgi:UDP-N-acetylglucosamine transferase subunit ALG13